MASQKVLRNFNVCKKGRFFFFFAKFDENKIVPGAPFVAVDTLTLLIVDTIIGVRGVTRHPASLGKFSHYASFVLGASDLGMRGTHLYHHY